MPPSSAPRVIVLGDHETTAVSDSWTATADQHGVTVTEVFSFEPGEAAGADCLADVRGVVLALGRAVATATPIWMPCPREDLWREQHFRRLSLALQRHGLNLLYGAHFDACPIDGGISEIDYALRTEVRAVDELDRAALAAAGAVLLNDEIVMELVTGSTVAARFPATQTRRNRRVAAPDAADGTDTAPTNRDVSPPPRLPAATAPWRQRHPGLRQFAVWLVHGSGLTQTAAAQCLNATGHRTPQGFAWTQATVSRLIKGRYCEDN